MKTKTSNRAEAKNDRLYKYVITDFLTQMSTNEIKFALEKII
jgi:hypothetical protein